MPSREIAPPTRQDAVGALYVHVPFCVSKCAYCDFYSVPFDRQAAKGYLEALGAELSMQGRRLSRPLESIFVGGGTPVSLPVELLDHLLDLLEPLAGAGTEFTVEANPGTVTPEKASLLAARKVNRVSLGVQSLEPAELAVLGRIHSAEQASEAIDLLRKQRIDNLSIDLIYGVPGQTASSWHRTLDRAAALHVGHVSMYGLTFEEGTPLHRDLLAGRVGAMPEEEQRACYYDGAAFLASEGLGQYEISSFARPARRCRHNLTYWLNEPYLGLGPAAASYVDGQRRTTIPDLEQYVRPLLAGSPPPCQAERLSGQDAMAEAMMLGLRLIEGVDRRAFARRYGCDPAEAFPSTIDRYTRVGALLVDNSHIRLAHESLYVSDSVIADVLSES
jgi:oxygen-independent coproporphyrinogen-3 oxidase